MNLRVHINIVTYILWLIRNIHVCENVINNLIQAGLVNYVYTPLFTKYMWCDGMYTLYRKLTKP